MDLTGVYYDYRTPYEGKLIIMTADNASATLTGTLSWGGKEGIPVIGHYGQQQPGTVFIAFLAIGNTFKFYQSWTGYAQDDNSYEVWSTEGTQVDLERGSPELSNLPTVYWKKTKS